MAVMVSVVVSMLRGVNVGSHHRIKMAPLRALYESLELRDCQTYVQSGNVIFRTDARDLSELTKTIEDGIERSFGFRPIVILRTLPELREVVEGCPFTTRSGIDPGKLLVIFLSAIPDSAARGRFLGTHANPEEFLLRGRDLYVYYPDGMARSKLSPAMIEKALKVSGTARNWNSVTNMLEMAEKLRDSG